MILKGKVHKFGEDINTDYIISGRYKFSITQPEELAKHLMEDLIPDFYQKIQKGDFIVGGKNFGCGSSREQAPQAIKLAGISAVIAKSFARIFYRNAINIGLVLVETDTFQIQQGDRLELDFKKNILKDITQNIDIKIKPLPDLMLKILQAGGAIAHFKKHKALFNT